MLKKIILWLKKMLGLARWDPKSTVFTEGSFTGIINDKIKRKTGIKEFICLREYEKYFTFLRELKLCEDFQITTTYDYLILKGTYIKSPVFNENNKKLIIFCHGITNNRWSLFYVIHLVLQVGYSVLIYDARNHGKSEKFYLTLGKNEANDLEDIINWAKERIQPTAVALYGFSMGAATLLFWLSNFQRRHLEVKAVICEAPFDNFFEQLTNFLSNPFWGGSLFFKKKEIFFWKNIQRFFSVEKETIITANPLDELPYDLAPKLLLLHGLKDKIISWQSSLNIWKHFQKNMGDNSRVNAYFFHYAGHGEVPFFGDALANNIRWIKQKKSNSRFSYSSLLYSFLTKNL